MRRGWDEDSLWQRLQEFEIDVPGAHLTFRQRLARENGWSQEFAQRAIEEYRRFVLLAMTAGHPVTPSDEVDQVWHLHLCYTRSYWDDLCAKVLERPLHHGPTLGGGGERAKFDDWYRRTLVSYERRFGVPPADLWPPPHVRFAPRRGRRHRRIALPRAPLVGVAGALLCLLALGCSRTGGDMTFASTVALLGVFGVVAVLVCAMRESPSRGSGRGGGDGGDGGCGVGKDGGHVDFGGGGDGGGDGGDGCGGGCGD
ncbi:MAG: hypothetical protein AB8H80_12595 [Planctomycetota bacterium]